MARWLQTQEHLPTESLQALLRSYSCRVLPLAIHCASSPDLKTSESKVALSASDFTAQIIFVTQDELVADLQLILQDRSSRSGGQNDTSEAEEEVWQKVRPYAEL
jgi:hypothetical protein